MTVTVKEQVAVLPAPSVAVAVTVVVPMAKDEPEAGLYDTVTPLPVAVAAKVTVAEHCPALVETVRLPGQAMLTRSSMTVTLKVQVAVLPAPSVAVAVTVVVPTAKELPDAGLKDTEAEQLSEAVAAKVTVAEIWPTSAVTEMFDGQVIVGAWVSLTVTVKEQVAVLPAPSVAVAVTVVVPRLKVEPDAGLYVTVAEQLSEAVAAKVTTAVQAPLAVLAVMLAGQVIVGATASPDKVSVVVAVAVAPRLSVTVTA